jgi:hypothetical protein
MWCTRLELAVLCLIAAAVLYQVMVPPVIGIADNGDFARVINPFCLGYVANQETEADYVVSKYEFTPDAYWDVRFVTSESLLAGIAILLNCLVSKDGFFDIRVIGLLHTAILLVAAWLLLICSRRLGRPARGVFIALLIVATTDVGYVQWLNSFYSETSSYLFFLLTAGLAWLLTQRRGGAFLLFVWALAAALLVGAKPQNAPLGLAVAVFAFQLRTLDAGRLWRRSCAGIAIAAVILSVVYSGIAPFPEMKEIARYDAVFYGILPESPTPAQDLAELGLSPDLARFTERSPYPPDSGVQDPAFREAFFARINYGKVLKFYAAHPRRLVSALGRSARKALLLRPGLSNFTREAGLAPNSRSHAFEVWSCLHEHVYPRRLAFLVIALGIYCAVLVLHRRTRSDTGEKLRADLAAIILVMAMIAYAVVAVTVGTVDTIKHMFLVNVLVDASLVVAAVWTAGRLADRFSHRA